MAGVAPEDRPCAQSLLLAGQTGFQSLVTRAWAWAWALGGRWFGPVMDLLAGMRFCSAPLLLKGNALALPGTWAAC